MTTEIHLDRIRTNSLNTRYIPAKHTMIESHVALAAGVAAVGLLLLHLLFLLLVVVAAVVVVVGVCWCGLFLLISIWYLIWIYAANCQNSLQFKYLPNTLEPLVPWRPFWRSSFNLHRFPLSFFLGCLTATFMLGAAWLGLPPARAAGWSLRHCRLSPLCSPYLPFASDMWCAELFHEFISSKMVQGATVVYYVRLVLLLVPRPVNPSIHASDLQWPQWYCWHCSYHHLTTHSCLCSQWIGL